MANWYERIRDTFLSGNIKGKDTGSVTLSEDTTGLVLVADTQVGIVVYVNQKAVRADDPKQNNRPCTRVYPGCGLHITPVEGSHCYDVEDNLGNTIRICPEH